MKRQLIEDIAVGCFRYGVAVDPVPFRARAEHDGDDGYVNHDRGEMVIRPDMGICRQQETVMHEVMHAVWHMSGLPRKDSEEVVKRISPLLLDTLRRNPHLRDFLLGEP